MMRSLLWASALVCVGVLGLACGDDKSSSKTNDAGTLTDAERTCPAFCKRADECGLLASKNISVAECGTMCVAASPAGECPAFTDAEAKACTSAAAAQSCTDVTNGVLPTACEKTCQVADKSVAPATISELVGQ